MTYKQIHLKRGKDESLRRFHPWVFSGAIARVDDNAKTEELLIAAGFALCTDEILKKA